LAETQDLGVADGELLKKEEDDEDAKACDTAE
jgi:hypothetical protein